MDAEREQLEKRGNWLRASELAAQGTGHGVKSYSEKLCLWAYIKIHLQGISKYIKVQDIVNFCATSEMLAIPKGQYANSHEREDVVQYWQEVFLSQMIAYFLRMWCWIEEHGWNIPPPFHDKSTFYAHDCYVLCWVPLGTKPVPYVKGEGASLIIAHFVSANYGWLDAPDNNEMDLVQGMMDILQMKRPWINLRRPLSKMTKWPSDDFFIEVNIKGANAKPVPDRKLLKEKHQMKNTFFDGVKQSLYFADDHPIHPGKFKGMAQILTECGYDVSRKKA
ncbi:hypothetical protein ARMGADRAFT_1029997 [Armillaria gallica]|uniref:Uncharacterized protein n=1 Tax=Armillaria gallica TaxID=47427 RepID=A0A2H3DDN7_ARMGA|nr:hypothetical protein ARMGADRAFT_1029997 [Armillaria gallica]